MTNNFEVFIEDAGDSSVGIPSEQVFKAELCKNMVRYLKENKKLREFEKRLEELISEFYKI